MPGELRSCWGRVPSDITIVSVEDNVETCVVSSGTTGFLEHVLSPLEDVWRAGGGLEAQEPKVVSPEPDIKIEGA